MTDLRKAAEMALEALDWYVKEDDVIESMAGNEPWVEGKRNAEKAIQTLRQALAQEHEPWTPVEIGVDVTEKGTHVVGMYLLMPDVVRYVFHSKFYPTPKREWIGLTDTELDVIYEQHHNQYGECESPNFGYERAIEAKLKEKNNE